MYSNRHSHLTSVLLSIGTEAQCIGHFRLIFSLLRMTKATKLQKFALEVRFGASNTSFNMQILLTNLLTFLITLFEKIYCFYNINVIFFLLLNLFFYSLVFVIMFEEFACLSFCRLSQAQLRTRTV